jgi:multidrug efflux pump subunit AcrB
MKTLVSLLERKKAALCLLTGVCSISLFVIINSGVKINENKGGFYVVKIRHYGVNAEEMERSITVPLEDALSAVQGIMSLHSSSENSLSSVFIQLKPEARGRYEAVRDAVQRVYESLPSSVQRPEILSSDDSRIPVWSASFYSGGNGIHENIPAVQLLEKIVKPRLESLDGAGEVLISGTGIKEIIIILDQEISSSLGLEPSTVAAVLAMNDFIFPGGKIVHENKEIIVTVDGRYNDNSSLEKTFIPLENGKFVCLSDIAVISEKEKMPDILSRLNGRKTAGITIMGQHGADLRKLSSAIKKELSSLSLPLEYTVLSDLGAEEAAAYRSVIKAALSGAIMVAFISLILNNRNTNTLSGIFCALTIPSICLVSIAFLLIAGFSPDRLMLAGIAAGTGTAVDAVILASERLRKCTDYFSASAALPELASPLTAGAATTVAALIPLFSISENGAMIISASVTAVTLSALVISLTILPPLLLWKINLHVTIFHGKIPQIVNRLKRRFTKILCRLLAVSTEFCIRYPLFILGISIIFSALAILSLLIKGAGTSAYSSEDSIYAQVEFDGGLLAEEVDRLLAVYSEQLVRNAGIKNVETGARTGSGSLLISFDPGQTKAQIVRDMAKKTVIPGGFVFFHENSIYDRYWEIKIYGEEDIKCRALAEELAYLCGNHKLVRECVFNFKSGSKKLVLLPDRELFAEAGTAFFKAALGIRTGVYGPVAYKRMGLEGETDVRIFSGGRDFINNIFSDIVLRQSRKGTFDTLVPGGKENAFGRLHIHSLMRTREETEPASIRRDNRRRTASITITTKAMDARRVKKRISPLFEKLELPQGYSIEFDPDAIRESEALSGTIISFIMAVIFCYMIIASINESFSFPLLILAAVPASLSIPALFLVISGSAFNSAVACAFIAASGMTVNAAILCADGLKTQANHGITVLNLFLALRRKMPALLATTGTTAAGSIPFLFLTEGANTLIRTLSLVCAIGVICSFICSITLIPSLFIVLKIKFSD